MGQFCVISDDIMPDEELRKLVKTNFKDSYRVSRRVWLVRAEGFTTDIKKLLGFDDEVKNGGIVISVNSIGGFYDAGLWEWADKDKK